MVRKHCGKRRNCSLRAISPFPTVFSKESYCRQVKTRVCLGKGYVHLLSSSKIMKKQFLFYSTLPMYLSDRPYPTSTVIIKNFVVVNLCK